jgi:hypothetical protein
VADGRTHSVPTVGCDNQSTQSDCGRPNWCPALSTITLPPSVAPVGGATVGIDNLCLHVSSVSIRYAKFPSADATNRPTVRSAKDRNPLSERRTTYGGDAAVAEADSIIISSYGITWTYTTVKTSSMESDSCGHRWIYYVGAVGNSQFGLYGKMQRRSVLGDGGCTAWPWTINGQLENWTSKLCKGTFQ